jgi:hypothetical protein
VPRARVLIALVLAALAPALAATPVRAAALAHTSAYSTVTAATGAGPP